MYHGQQNGTRAECIHLCYKLLGTPLHVSWPAKRHTCRVHTFMLQATWPWNALQTLPWCTTVNGKQPAQVCYPLWTEPSTKRKQQLWSTVRRMSHWKVCTARNTDSMWLHLHVCCLCARCYHQLTLLPRRACAEIDRVVMREADKKWRFCVVLFHCVISFKIAEFRQS